MDRSARRCGNVAAAILETAMEFLVAAAGKNGFHCTLDTVPDKQPGAIPCHKGKPCTASVRCGGCPLLLATGPVLDYFSDVSSHETVSVRYRDAGYVAAFRETGQKAAFALLLQTMLHSPCPFFGRFAPLFASYRANVTYEMFMQLVLTTALVRRVSKTPEGLGMAAVRNDVRRLGDEIEARLQPLLAEARRRQIKDAAVNALTIMFNLNMMAAEGIEDYQQEIADTLGPLGRPVDALRQLS